MASLSKRRLKKGTGWRIDYRLAGKFRSEYLPPGTPLPLARQYLSEIERRLIESKLNGVPYASPLKQSAPAGAGILLSQFIEKILEFSRATKSESTFLLDRHSLRLFLAAAGDIPLGKIDYQTAQDHALRRLKSVKPTSVNIEIRQLKAAFHQAVKWGHLRENPFRDVKKVKVKDADFPKFLTKEEVRRLLDVIEPGRFRDLIRFYLHTGCRRDEALSLTWEDIDLQRGTVFFRKTKTGLSRLVPLNHEISAVIAEISREGKPFPFLPGHVTRACKRYMRTAGLSPSLHLHSLRHTFASHLVMAGENLYTVSKLLGHSEVQTTQVYAHLAPDHLKAAAEKVAY